MSKPAQELTPAERRVQGIAAVVGLVVAIAASVLLAMSSGIEIGIAVFFLSWTGIALFVLLVRTVYRRLAAPSTAPAARQATSTPAAAQPRSRRARKRKAR